MKTSFVEFEPELSEEITRLGFVDSDVRFVHVSLGRLGLFKKKDSVYEGNDFDNVKLTKKHLNKKLRKSLIKFYAEQPRVSGHHVKVDFDNRYAFAQLVTGSRGPLLLIRIER